MSIVRLASLHLAILHGAALLVPGRERAEWFAEWTSELWYARQRGAREATRFCLGAFRDAIWLRRNSRNTDGRREFRLQSPVSCILLLAVLAAGSLFFAIRLPGVSCMIPPSVSAPVEEGRSGSFECVSLARDKLALVHLLMIFIAVLILPATTSMGLGEYPASRYSPPLATRLRRWIFLALKVVLLTVIVFCGILDLASITSTKIQPHGLLVGYVLSFRWALSDQRKRCPVCLRLLSNPTRIGWSSQTFLEWYGTELICDQGHGLLHVPEIPTSCYSTQRWQYLDPSWSGLFSSRKVGAIQ